mmetsp:Transcript_15914/g.50014  ORF Transcript_15914/g.50014 Transcript_15914/m.50014 type:complete len:207 (-) Transcript_15914:344-964(-)
MRSSAVTKSCPGGGLPCLKGWKRLPLPLPLQGSDPGEPRPRRIPRALRMLEGETKHTRTTKRRNPKTLEIASSMASLASSTMPEKDLSSSHPMPILTVSKRSLPDRFMPCPVGLPISPVDMPSRSASPLAHPPFFFAAAPPSTPCSSSATSSSEVSGDAVDGSVVDASLYASSPSSPSGKSRLKLEVPTWCLERTGWVVNPFFSSL